LPSVGSNNHTICHLNAHWFAAAHTSSRMVGELLGYTAHFTDSWGIRFEIAQ
jgi:hypothetical protein